MQTNKKKKSPSYPYHLIPKPLNSYSTRNSENLPPIKGKNSFFKNTFFLSTIIEWSKLDSNVHCSPFYKVCRKWILEFIRPHPNSIFHAWNSLSLTYLIRLRVGLNHLREHKFAHNFQDSKSLICNCDNSAKSTRHCLLHWSNFKNERQPLF